MTLLHNIDSTLPLEIRRLQRAEVLRQPTQEPSPRVRAGARPRQHECARRRLRGGNPSPMVSGCDPRHERPVMNHGAGSPLLNRNLGHGRPPSAGAVRRCGVCRALGSDRRGHTD